jgi:GNAT superfamily N-acetyltransferase
LPVEPDIQKVKTSIHVWHLEMTSRPETSEPDTHPYQLLKVEHPLPELNRFLYATVGASCMWYMRLPWKWQQWHDYVARKSIETWVAYQGATPIGYFELEKQPRGSTEIAYFGLIPEFVGQGLGRQLLRDAVNKAWDTANNRIWLHTCTLDHPNALPNYLNRGFKVFKEEDIEEMIPAEPLQPWEGAAKPA